MTQPLSGEPDQNGSPQTPREPARGLLSTTIAGVRDLMLSVVIAILVILFLYQPVKVEGTSMMPSLEDQERIFINKFVYRFGMGNVERGDMVVFWYPGDPSKSYIKRVIGLPGDRVEIREGEVFLNGEPLNEDYVPDYYRDRQSSAELTVPPEHYYVLGDHRSSSNDSRSWGPVHRRHIYGKAVFVYWPLDKIGLIH
ncbi:MAG: signal peptidase I [Bryobacterales bacterium]|nr:signal peptidase I [Bryobacterales bacterium]